MPAVKSALVVFALMAFAACHGGELRHVSDLAEPSSSSYPAQSCKTYETKCNGWCADLSSNASNCGRCGNPCLGNGARCVDGECTCPSAQEQACGGMCVNTNVDSANCGDCNHACGAGLECRDGKCGCLSLGTEACDGQCVDMSSDAKNCGECGKACAPDLVCAGGACACPKDTQRCDDACVDTRFAADSCGGCSERCPVEKICTSGACEPPSGDWPVLQSDSGHTGVNSSELGKPPLVQAWTREVASGPSQLSAPAIANGRVFIRTTEDPQRTRLFALNLSDGSELWSYDFGAQTAASPPAVADGVVYIASGASDPQVGSSLFAFDAVSGTKRWATPIQASVLDFGAPIILDDSVYGSAALDRLFSMSKSDGSVRFSVSVGGSIYTWTPAICGGQLFASTNGRFTQYDLTTGMMGASLVIGSAGSLTNGTPVCSGASAYVTSSQTLYAIDMGKDQVTWTVNGLFNGAPAVHAGSLYWIDQGKLVVVDASSGNEQWRVAADGGLQGAPVIANDYVYVASAMNLFAIRISSREQVDQKMLDVGMSVDSSLALPGVIAIASRHVLVTGADGKLRAFALSP